jgi:hypothetical protein
MTDSPTATQRLSLDISMPYADYKSRTISLRRRNDDPLPRVTGQTRFEALLLIDRNRTTVDGWFCTNMK